MNLLNHYPEIVAAYPEYITQKQLCEVCGVCHKTAYNLERRGEIPYKVVDTPTGRIHHIKLIDALAYDVAINNEKLADALTALPDDKRDIVLLAYFLDMSDQEIADKLNMVRRTVQYRRTSSLKEMKQRLEVHEDGGQSEE